MMDGIRNEDVLEIKTEKPDWHVQRIDSSISISRKTLRLEVAGRGPGGKAERRFMNVVKEDMRLVGVIMEDALNRERWRQMTGGEKRRSHRPDRTLRHNHVTFCFMVLKFCLCFHLCLWNSSVMYIFSALRLTSNSMGIRSTESENFNPLVDFNPPVVQPAVQLPPTLSWKDS